MAKQIFKGFKQVSAAQFNAAKESNLLNGYMWFVRTEVSDGEVNNTANDEYDIYFGSKHYGHFCEGELPGIKANIETLLSDVASLKEADETISGIIDTLTGVVEANQKAIEDNTKAIGTINSNLEALLIKDIDANDKVLSVADGILSSAISLKYESNRISLIGKDNAEIAGFDASEFIKDSVLEDVKVETRENEKYIVFTWKTEGEETKTDEIKVSDFAKLYEAGKGLELAADGVTFNVKVAENDNFLSVNDNNELIVDDMTVDKTKIKEDITIEGGPLASDAVKAAFDGGVIPAGTDIQSVLKALLCVEIYPTSSKNTPKYSVSINAPSISEANGVKSGDIVEVGLKLSFNAVSAKSVSKTPTNPVVSGLEHGYSSTIDGDINENTSISAEWTISQKENNVYELSASKTNFTGDVPTTVTGATASECQLAACELTVAEGDNTYSVTEDAPKHVGSHPGVASVYIVSNLGGRSEDKKSVAISAESDVEKDPSNQTASFTVTGVYPVYTNGVTASTEDATAAAMEDLAAHVGGNHTKLALMKSGTQFAVSFAAHTEGVEGYRLYLPGEWKVTEAYGINANTAQYSVNQTSKFVPLAEKVTKTVQGNNVTYTVYEYLATEGANRVRFKVG